MVWIDWIPVASLWEKYIPSFSQCWRFNRVTNEENNNEFFHKLFLIETVKYHNFKFPCHLLLETTHFFY